MHGHGGNFALRASENVVNLFSLEGRTTERKLSMWSEFNTSGNSKGLLSKHKIDKQTYFLETPPKSWNSLPRHQVDGKMIMQIMLRKAVVTSRFALGRQWQALWTAYPGGTFEGIWRKCSQDLVAYREISHCRQASAQCCLTCTIVLLKSKLKEKIDEMKSKASLSRKLSQKNGSVVRTEARDT